MGVVSGITAVVSNQKTVSGWAISYSNAPANYVGTGMGAGEASENGNFDWTGSFNFYGTVPDVLPGASISFVGFTGTDRWSGTALVESLTINANIEGGGIFSGSVTFGGNSALVAGAGTNTDANLPDPRSCVGLGADWDGSALSDVRTWNLTLTRNLRPYVSSTTAGVTKRVAATYAANGSISVYQDAAASLLAPGATKTLDLYVTSSTYYSLSYAKILTVAHDFDPETGNPVGATYSWQWTSHDRIAGTVTRGDVLLPSGSAWWE